MPEIGAISQRFRQYRDTGAYNYLRYTTLVSPSPKQLYYFAWLIGHFTLKN